MIGRLQPVGGGGTGCQTYRIATELSPVSFSNSDFPDSDVGGTMLAKIGHRFHSVQGLPQSNGSESKSPSNNRLDVYEWLEVAEQLRISD